MERAMQYVVCCCGRRDPRIIRQIETIPSGHGNSCIVTTLLNIPGPAGFKYRINLWMLGVSFRLMPTVVNCSKVHKCLSYQLKIHRCYNDGVDWLPIFDGRFE